MGALRAKCAPDFVKRQSGSIEGRALRVGFEVENDRLEELVSFA
jgi:hypothetical protein